jgi:hypothetical protein
LFAAAVDFQVTQDESSFPLRFEENERVRGPKPCRVEHVCIILARGDDEAGLCISDFGFQILDFHE